MRRTATKLCSNSAVAVVKAEATRGSATCAYDTFHLVQLYPHSQHSYCNPPFKLCSDSFVLVTS